MLVNKGVGLPRRAGIFFNFDLTIISPLFLYAFHPIVQKNILRIIVSVLPIVTYMYFT